MSGLLKAVLIRLIIVSLISVLADALLPENGISDSARKLISIAAISAVLLPALRML